MALSVARKYFFRENAQAIWHEIFFKTLSGEGGEGEKVLKNFPLLSWAE